MKVTDVVCPFCEVGYGVELKTKRGRYYLACSHCAESWVTEEQTLKNEGLEGQHPKEPNA